MRRVIFYVLAIGLFQLCTAQIDRSKIPTHYSAKQYALNSSSFTDSSNYNSYYFNGNPLGKFEFDTNLVELKAGYRFFNSPSITPLDTTGTFNGFVLPEITLRPTFSTLISFNYSLNSAKSDELSLPLHQFGFLMMSQAKNSVFQGGITGQGFIGTEKESDGENTRTIMGLKDAGICIGSKITPEVALGVYAHSAFFIDTIFNANEDQLLQERLACVKLPQIDASADITIPGIKDKANISYTFAKQHFVYTQKSDNEVLMNTFRSTAGDNRNTSGDNESEHQWDGDPIVNDSMLIALQNMVTFDINDNVALIPSFTIGYMHNSFVRMNPGKDNHPLSYEGEKKGYDWQTGSFRFGIGSTVQLFDMSSIWIEYAHSSLSLSLGDKYSDSLNDSKSNGYNRFGIGTQFSFAKLPAFSRNAFDLSLRVGYVFEERNDLLSTYNGEAFSFVQPMMVNTQLYRYTPWQQFREKISSSGIQTGLRTAFKDETFITDLYFLYAKQSITGDTTRDGHDVQIGLDMVLNVKARSKK